jgi:large subunit ribosomal protein L21
MFAVLKTGGKQYKVSSGDTLQVEKLAADAGETVQFNDILMLGGDNVTVGAPFIDGAAVQAEVVDQIKGDKVIHFVKRRRKHGSKRTKGHRQQLTLLRVTDILEKGAGDTGVKAAVGAGILPRGTGTERFTKNRADQAEMKKRVKTGEAEAKSVAMEEPKAKTDAASKAAATGADDLKQLSGVGPAIEKKLHAAGITTFAQIAAWTDEDVARFDEELSFKGRIEREGWIAQAKDLAADSK